MIVFLKTNKKQTRKNDLKSFDRTLNYRFVYWTNEFSKKKKNIFSYWTNDFMEQTF